jgi:hypothetical protein
LLGLGSLSLGVVLVAAPGATEPAKDKSKTGRNCANTYGMAVQLEQSGKLRQARDLLLACANAPCSGLVRQQCWTRYAQLESDIPSVVPLVTGDDGDPRVDVQVSIDNEPLTNRIDGRSLPVDPGLHEFSFTSEGRVLATQKVLILQGQRNRPIAVAIKPPAVNAKSSPDKPPVDKATISKREPDMPASEKAAPANPAVDKPPAEPRVSEAPPPEAPKNGGPGAMPWILGGVGLAGLGAAGLLTYWGRRDNDRLSECRPNCSTESLDHIRRLYLASDVSLGVGAAALATGVVWYFVGAPSKEESHGPAYRLDVRPIASGTFATLSGSF